MKSLNSLADRSVGDLRELSLLLCAMADAKGRADQEAVITIDGLFQHRLEINTTDRRWLEEVEIAPSIDLTNHAGTVQSESNKE
jgi:hypothetical protein